MSERSFELAPTLARLIDGIKEVYPNMVIDFIYDAPINEILFFPSPEIKTIDNCDRNLFSVFYRNGKVFITSDF